MWKLNSEVEKIYVFFRDQKERKWEKKRRKSEENKKGNLMISLLFI